MKKLVLVSLCFGFATSVNAGYLDDWSNDQLCGWMDSNSTPEYIKEEVESSEGKRGTFIAAQVSRSSGEGRGIRTKAAYCEIQFEGSHSVRIESRESMGYLKELMGGVV